MSDEYSLMYRRGPYIRNKLSIYSIEVTKDVLGKVYKTKWNDGWNDKKHWKRLR